MVILRKMPSQNPKVHLHVLWSKVLSPKPKGCGGGTFNVVSLNQMGKVSVADGLVSDHVDPSAKGRTRWLLCSLPFALGSELSEHGQKYLPSCCVSRSAMVQ